MKFVVFVLVNALAVAAAAWMLDGITVGESDVLRTVNDDRWATLALVGVVLGVVNAIVRPVVKVLSLPVIILTLGLAILVINALMLMLTSKIADGLGLGFHVDGFWTAVFGGIIVSITAMVLEATLPDGK